MARGRREDLKLFMVLLLASFLLGEALLFLGEAIHKRVS